MAYELARGPIAEGAFVMHLCDNRRCVRPDHLFLGTSADNTADMVAKRRMPIRERHHNAKLTSPVVLAIKQRHAAGQATLINLAREYGVSHGTIYDIVHGRTWRTLTG